MSQPLDNFIEAKNPTEKRFRIWMLLSVLLMSVGLLFIVALNYVDPLHDDGWFYLAFLGGITFLLGLGLGVTLFVARLLWRRKNKSAEDGIV